MLKCTLLSVIFLVGSVQGRAHLGTLKCYPKTLQEVGRLRRYLMADSCPNKVDSSKCAWAGDSVVDCYLTYYSDKLRELEHEAIKASWNYNTNITDHNAAIVKEKSKVSAAWAKGEWLAVLQNFTAPAGLHKTLKRKMENIKYIGSAGLDDKKYEELIDLSQKMQRAYSTAKICPFNKRDCDLETEGMPLEGNDGSIKDVLTSSTDSVELAYIWGAWRDKLSVLKPDFIRRNELLKEAALINGVSDYEKMWNRNFERPDFEDFVDNIWDSIRPFYQEIHAYARHKLIEAYSKRNALSTTGLTFDGLLPAHLFGNMWAQSWEERFEELKFGNADFPDLDQALKNKYESVEDFFKVADDFFQDIGLDALPETFYDRSMLTKPEGREVVCHASAWDFLDPPDVRVKMCTKFKFTDFDTVHHELGHIQYFLLYKDQDVLFREGADDGFHEAVGDLMSLSVNTPKHLMKLGLIKGTATDQNAANNQLLLTALKKIVFLPFALIMDKYRWALYRDEIQLHKLNLEWWKLKKNYQGVGPPLERDENDFDFVSKYHSAANVQYIRYFMAVIYQFAFHKDLCQLTGQYDPAKPDENPLFECDISDDPSGKAGDKLRKILSLGASLPATETLSMFIGDEDVTSGLLEYFRPLRKAIQEYLTENNIPVGWPET